MARLNAFILLRYKVYLSTVLFILLLFVKGVIVFVETLVL